MTLGPTRGNGTVGALRTGTHGESGEPGMRGAISKSYENRHEGKGYRTGIMGAGAPHAVRLERNGIHPVDCVAFLGLTDRL